MKRAGSGLAKGAARPRPGGWAAGLLSLLMAAAAGLAGCGGGVGTGGTGISTASAYASGPITGFGSIIVQGVHYDEQSAAVLDDDDQPQARASLALGMVVEIDSDAPRAASDGLTRATASRVAIRPAVIGEAAAVDAAAGRLQVQGQRVRLDAGTVIDPALTGGLAGLSAGRMVEVHGLWDASDGSWRATRLAAAPAGLSPRVRGAVEAIDGPGGSVTIGGQRYPVDSVTQATARIGQPLRLVEPGAGTGGKWQGRGNAGSLGDRGQVDLRGLVAALNGPLQFTIDGTRIDARNARIDGQLGLGVEVRVEGALVGGTLMATQIQVRGSGGGGQDAIEVRGRITTLDLLGLMLVVADSAGRTTPFGLGRVDLQVNGGLLGSLRTGGVVDVRGQPSPDGTRIDAVKIVIGG